MITLIIFNVFYIGIINMCWIACNAGILVYYFVVYWILLMSWWLIVIVTSFNDCIYLIVVFFIECSDNFMILQCVIKMCQKCQKCHKQIDWISQTLSTFSIRVIQCHLTILSEQHKFHLYAVQGFQFQVIAKHFVCKESLKKIKNITV